MRALGLLFLFASCCASGPKVDLMTHVASQPGPRIVVYYPEHATWNTGMLSAEIRVDGERAGRLCEGRFLVLPVEPGSYVLTTSRDSSWGCQMSGQPEGGWPPVTVDVTDGPVFVRYGAVLYRGPESTEPICFRRLARVDEEAAGQESGTMRLTGTPPTPRR